MIKPIRLDHRFALLVKERRAVWPVGIDKQYLPAVLNGFNDVGVVDSGSFGRYFGHTPRVQEKLNECKR